MKTVIGVILDILDYIGSGLMYVVIGSLWVFSSFVIPAVVVIALHEGATAYQICMWVYVCGYAFAAGVAVWWTARKLRYGERREIVDNIWGFPVLCAGWPIVIGVSLTCAFAFGVVYMFEKLYSWSHSK